MSTRGYSCDGPASHPGGVEILLATLCYRNQDKLWPNGPLGSYADFAFSFSSSVTVDKSFRRALKLLFLSGGKFGLILRVWRGGIGRGGGVGWIENGKSLVRLKFKELKNICAS